MPCMALGTWRTDNSVLRAALVHAIAKSGYRSLDCAAMYGNEQIVGEAVAASGVPRSELFITSKLMPTDSHAEHASAALDKTLRDLGTTYLDCYLLHWPFRLVNKPSSFPVPPAERLGYDRAELLKVWRELEKAVDDGRVRALGVSNFSRKKLEALLEDARHKPACNQLEAHPYLAQRALVDWHRERGVVVTCYCPLGSPARPPAFLHADDPPNLLSSPAIAAVAARHSRSPAQVLLKWALQRGTVPLPKSVTPARLDENIAAAADAAFALTDEDMAQIDALDRHWRYSRGEHFLAPGMERKDIFDEE
jgi:diketogulonate reductase-like aldo/keto reductase